MATIKYWDGSAWQYAVVGKQGPVGATGPTGPAGEATLQRFRFVATGGETSLSGADANGNTLAYTAGLEEVFINGAAQVRGQDYVATNGTSITSLAALTASDVVEILAWGVFDVANTIPNTLVDAKGDLLVGSAADTVSRLAVGANDTVLTADSSTATGLKWAAVSAGGMTLLSTTSLSGASTSITSISSNYTNLQIVISRLSLTADQRVTIQFNNDSGTNYQFNNSGGTSIPLSRTADVDQISSASNNFVINIYRYTTTNEHKPISISGGFVNASTGAQQTFADGGAWRNDNALTSIQINTSSATFDGGTVYIYGVK